VRIFLVGPMGAGKSTVGRELARRLGCAFIDTDAEIEKRTGADIPWIFEIEGEQGFRDREAQVVKDTCDTPDVVIATGGGAILRQENRDCMRDNGFVVYLAATVKEQVRRTGKEGARPLLAGKNRAEVLTELMAIREPLYRGVAHLELATRGSSARRLAEKIAESAESYTR